MLSEKSIPRHRKLGQWNRGKTSKCCKKCLIEKPISDFYQYRYVCKQCATIASVKRNRKNKDSRRRAVDRYNERNKEALKTKRLKYRNDNREKVLISARKTALKRRLRIMGISENDLPLVLEAQNGVCAICLTIDVRAINTRNVHLDHCHKTGTFRGILCPNCNLSLGRFEDNPERLIRAAEYVRCGGTQWQKW
jgi:hypothetical protein